MYRVITLIGLLICVSASSGATSVGVTSGLFSNDHSATTITFDSGLPPGFVVNANSGIENTSVPDLYLGPEGDRTPYVYVGQNSFITATFATGIDYLGLYWGSPDEYNSISLEDSNGLIQTYGRNGQPMPGLHFDTTSEYVNFFDNGVSWVDATFSSTGASFEFDNLAFDASFEANPEPPTIVFCAIGLVSYLAAKALSPPSKIDGTGTLWCPYELLMSNRRQTLGEQQENAVPFVVNAISPRTANLSKARSSPLDTAAAPTASGPRCRLR